MSGDSKRNALGSDQIAALNHVSLIAANVCANVITSARIKLVKRNVYCGDDVFAGFYVRLELRLRDDLRRGIEF